MTKFDSWIAAAMLSSAAAAVAGACASNDDDGAGRSRAGAGGVEGDAAARAVDASAGVGEADAGAGGRLHPTGGTRSATGGGDAATPTAPRGGSDGGHVGVTAEDGGSVAGEGSGPPRAGSGQPADLPTAGTSSEGGSTTATGGAQPAGGSGSEDAGFVIGPEGIEAFDALSNDEQDALRSTKVFFLHMSVGGNLVAGYDRWDPPWVAGTNSLGFVFDGVYYPTDYEAGVTLGEAYFGDNGDPFLKISMYRDWMLDQGIGERVEVAGFKFCYNDITMDTVSDLEEVTSAYQNAYADIEAGTEGVRFLHFTTPLQPADQWQTVENNTLRVELGDFVASRYSGGRHVVFDLQAIESTNASGSRCDQDGVIVLCEEWKGDDDGHLNDAGSTRAAKAFLYALHVARNLEG